MMRLRTTATLLALFTFSVATTGCDSSQASPTKDKAAAGQGEPHPGLLDPSKATDKAPDTFKAKFDTTKGPFVVSVNRAWSPNGADRFYNLVNIGFFNDVSLFRAVPNFVVQFGISGDPAVSRAWEGKNVKDDPVVESNKRGYLTFAKASLPNSRSTQLFVNLADNDRLDQMGFAPIGQITEGLEIVETLYMGYGEKTTQLQGQIKAEGNVFLKKSFPELDYIKTATIVQ